MCKIPNLSLGIKTMDFSTRRPRLTSRNMGVCGGGN